MEPDPPVPERYLEEEVAQAYRRKYAVSFARRLSNRRELSLVGRALARFDSTGRVLDCPCGAGRLVPTLLAHADHVTAVDASPAMVAEARRALEGRFEPGQIEFAVANADRLPFEDDSFDVVVCHRLLHHVPGAEDRGRILRELARVARQGIVLSFSDASTRKMRWLRLRGRAHRRMIWHPDQLRSEAAQAGLRLQPPVRRVSSLFSLVAIARLRPTGEAGPRAERGRDQGRRA